MNPAIVPTERQINVSYKGTQIGLLIAEPAAIALTINGIVRARNQSTQSPNAELSLSSSVQTDYEWHEFVEVKAIFTGKRVFIRISANKALLREETISL